MAARPPLRNSVAPRPANSETFTPCRFRSHQRSSSSCSSTRPTFTTSPKGLLDRLGLTDYRLEIVVDETTPLNRVRVSVRRRHPPRCRKWRIRRHTTAPNAVDCGHSNHHRSGAVPGPRPYRRHLRRGTRRGRSRPRPCCRVGRVLPRKICPIGRSPCQSAALAIQLPESPRIFRRQRRSIRRVVVITATDVERATGHE